jgi:hypothetical protein
MKHLVAVFFVLAGVGQAFAPAEAGPAQRLAERRGISVRAARRILNPPMVAGPAAPNAGNGGSTFVDPAGPGVGPAPVQP